MTQPPLERFSERIRRLEEERLYCRQGWRVPVRTVRVDRSRWSWSLFLKEWLMYPLFSV